MTALPAEAQRQAAAVPRFIAQTRPDEPQSTPGLWFIYQGSRLLVAPAGDAVQIPRLTSPDELRLEPTHRQFLGQWDGVPCHGVAVAEDTPAPAGHEWQGLRALFGRLEDDLVAVAGRALQVMDWDRTHQFCGRCATATVQLAHERSRRCPSCGLVSYPRISPVVMALILRGRELLLARSPHFPPGMYSAVAGFVEVGESLEDTVAREVLEETGVQVTDLAYHSSQSWPFPHSLMVAFTCRYVAGTVRPQPDEIEDVRWFSIDALPTLPSRLSIARRLIDTTVARLRDLPAEARNAPLT